MGATRDMTYANIFRRAAEILGSEHDLRRLLEVTQEQLESWLSGHAKPSAEALAKVVDVLIAHVEGKIVRK
jgi:succinate dehydrogenase flavin-adding protein (antitoxin of CptAB toxin-antitoxin module)